MAPGALLDVRDLTVRFRREAGWLTAVDRVSFSIAAGECVALAGESGSGKSTLARAITGLVRPHSGEIRYRGEPMPRHMRRRTAPWLEMQMVFQDPGGSLDPRQRVGSAIKEVLKLHDLPRNAPRAERAAELLEWVGLSPDVAHQLPSRLSGGQKQRAAIALALAMEPRLLVCDEAVSALDVSVRAQILTVLKRLQRQLGLAYLFITHDLGVVKQIADRALVMYGGQIVESAANESLFEDPLHPYTRLLIDSVPTLDGPQKPHPTRDLAPQGEVIGCVFASRCSFATDESRTVRPTIEEVGDEHAIACHNWRSIRTQMSTDVRPRSGHAWHASTGLS